jgi:hypothetical protein
MTRIRSAELLPEIFKTETNKKFLSSTLDQLIQEPKLKQTQGYIGRKDNTVEDGDYLVEINATRSNYQLEPGVVFNDSDGNVDDVITYPEIIDALSVAGGNVERHDRLFKSQLYSWEPLVDLDMLINYSQYYWVPSGPSAVDVQSTIVPLTDEFTVDRDTVENVIRLSGEAGENPIITLARGGVYTFITDNNNGFYIQSQPGTNGTLAHASNISSRDVLGVENNGGFFDQDTNNQDVIFRVPQSDAQQFYYDLLDVGTVDIATDLKFNQVSYKFVRDLPNIDNITDMDGKTIVFLDDTPGASIDTGWVYENLWDDDDQWEGDTWEDVIPIDLQADRYSIYQIEYVYNSLNEDPYIKLNKITGVDQFSKFKINYGEAYGNFQFYKDAEGYFRKVPLLTAALDRIYYQDQYVSGMSGIINIVDAEVAAPIDIEEDILGKKEYTSKNGVVFTNGLKIIFRGEVNQSEYLDTSYYIEGVGIGIVLVPVTDLITPEAFTGSITEPYDSSPFDEVGLDGNLSYPTNLDYITINRASRDLNPWTRNNRWFHRDVLNITAEYNNFTPVLDNDNRAKRPILSFNAGLKLADYGTESKSPISVIDFVQTDALNDGSLDISNDVGVNNVVSYQVDGYSLHDGARVIFANDADPEVKNKIYVVNFVDVDGDDEKRINLVEATDYEVLTNNCVLCLNGLTQQGKVFYFDGTDWVNHTETQQKTQLQQSPLFDIFDTAGVSLTNTTKYPDTTFNGTSLFSYSVGTGTNDTVLGFPLTYRNIDNLGDIVFDNNLYGDTFQYTSSGSTITSNIHIGFAQVYSDRTTNSIKNGWTKFADSYYPCQKFNFKFLSNNSYELDVLPKDNIRIPAIKVYVDGVFYPPSEYTVTSETAPAIKTKIVFNNTRVNFTVQSGNSIDINIISDANSQIGYYEVPKNLENNIFNQNNTTLTLGTVRNHYNNLAQNLINLTGDIHGANNSRDLGNISAYGDIIIHNSAPVSPLATFLRKKDYNIFESIKFNDNQYEQFKNKTVSWVMNNDTTGMDVNDILDAALLSINVGKGPSSAFYWSDMLPTLDDYTTTNHTVTAISTVSFNTINVYDFTKSNLAGLLVYLNGTLLIKDTDYTVATDGPRIEMIASITDGDIIRIDEYTSSIGSYVPNTPTKMGLYPKFKPEVYVDDSYVVSQTVIRGHDGSITIAYGDIRDDILLEFEKRIYNNIKINTDVPLLSTDVIPGKFRTTDYDDATITDILSTDFLNWIGWNRIDYKTQDYLSQDEFTWNYSTAGSRLDDTALKGHWRGIYREYYDTDTPHLTPWEMLGFSEKPSWWDTTYGPVPYTSGNLVLWEDLAAGLIKEPDNIHIDTRYIRTGLLDVIPVNTLGELISPFKSIVRNYSSVDFRKSWKFGDVGPVESAWRRSSAYAFAVQRLLALTKPAEYFTLLIDRDRYVYNNTLGQYIYDSRYHLDVTDIEVYGQDVPKHSYMNWVIDYNRFYGYNDGTKLKTDLTNLDVRLSYRMSSFSDKNYLKIFTEKSNPDSSNRSLIIPDESYQLLVHKNQNQTNIIYSSIIVQRTFDGYAVFGNSTSQQYFEILVSSIIADYDQFTVGGTTYRLPTVFTNNSVRVPYGYVFTDIGTVIDFIISYGRLLEVNGIQTNDKFNNVLLDWPQMAREFATWAKQDWVQGSLINLNPNASILEFEKEYNVVDSLLNLPITELPLDQDNNVLAQDEYIIDRIDNTFRLSTLTDKTINHLSLYTTSYEHILIFDNVSIFSDLIYEPSTGLRQKRVKIVGFTTYDWNGQMDAQGFILNQDNVQDWVGSVYYKKGDIVSFKNKLWTAVSNLEPTSEFEFPSWNQVDTSDIKTGLLPNASSKAKQATEYYNSKTANLESDVDLLGLGLIGFRPRSYLESIDDVSQVNVYQNVINQKGTLNSTNLFKGVKIDKEESSYDVFENWAIRRSIFGGSTNQAFLDIELEDSLLQSNPNIIEIGPVVNTITTPNQLVPLNAIYRQNEPHLTNNIFPILAEELTDITLPNAGYVHSSDVDIQTFSLDVLTETQIDSVVEDTIIHVAKDSLFDWNVYRADTVNSINNIGVVDDLTDASIDLYTITFQLPHELTTNDKIIVKGSHENINRAHGHNTSSPIDVIDEFSIRLTAAQIVESGIEVATADNEVITVDTTEYSSDLVFGDVYKLTTMRIPSISTIDSNIYKDGKIWADDTKVLYQNVRITAANSSITADDDNILADIFTITADDDLIESADSTHLSADITGIWTIFRKRADMVDTSLINSSLIYDKDTKVTTQELDYIDPLNGKILGVAQENIDYTNAIDPADYNYGGNSTSGIVWGTSHVGEIWWDLTDVRFIDYNQTDLVYSGKTWGLTFPGSTVRVYQWIQSNVPPAQYTGEGSVKNITDYTLISTVNRNGTIVDSYYYWVYDITTILPDSEKTLSVSAISSYINNPQASGISFTIFIQKNILGMYNVNRYLNNGVLHLEYSKTYSDTNVFAEFDLIRENHDTDFLGTELYTKLQDSFSAVSIIPTGVLPVPDPNLSEAERYGLDFRPRQTMFSDRLKALDVYLSQANRIFKDYAISENRSFDLLNSEEVLGDFEKGITADSQLLTVSVDTITLTADSDIYETWDTRVTDLTELGYQDLSLVSVGHVYLVDIDSSNDNLWSLYEVQLVDSVNTNVLTRVQSYYTPKYWDYIDWYQSTDIEFIIPSKTVDTVNDLSSIIPVEDQYVKVIKNNSLKWEIYQYQITDNVGEWVRVGLEDGTIAINSSLWETGTAYNEIRFIIRSINEELLIKDFSHHKNDLLILAFNYILSEQGNVDWLYKTSLIDVKHNMRSLIPYPTYRRDDQDFVLDYLNEVKPYHTKIKEFIVSFDGLDEIGGSILDYDVPSYYDTTFLKYISPILDDGAVLTSDQSNFDENGIGLKETPGFNIWESQPYNEWFQNYKLELESVTILESGTGYLSIPTITVVGTADTPAELSAKISSQGEITEIIVDNPGYGYIQTPTIQINGIGAGASAIPVMKNALIRNVKVTMKYDRYEYKTSIVDWVADTWMSSANLFRVNNKVYKVTGQRTVDDESTLTADVGYETSTIRYVPQYTVDSDYVTIDSDKVTADKGLAGYAQEYNSTLGIWEEISIDLYQLLAKDDLTVTADATTFELSTSSFDPSLHDLIEAETLSGVDRTSGFYVADVNNPGLDLSLLIDGIDYPGVVVTPPEDSFVNYNEDDLDTVYQGSFADIYTGTKSSDINVEGGGFVDTYSSHAPEELIPGSVFDTLDLTVVTRPGYDYAGNGHTFDSASKSVDYTTTNNVIDFTGLIQHPIAIDVINITTGKHLVLGDGYTIDWVNQDITILPLGSSDNDVIRVVVYEIGGGNQLYRTAIIGDTLVSDKISIPVLYSEIYNIVVLINGTETTGFTYAVNSLNTNETNITFTTPGTSTDYIAITVFGTGSPQYEYSYPRTQKFIASGASLDFTLTNSTDGTTRHNLIVEKNGERLRSPNAVRYIGTGSQTRFVLPNVVDVSDSIISNNEVIVYIDGVLQLLGSDYVVSPWPGGLSADDGTITTDDTSLTADGSYDRYVELTTPPTNNADVDVYVTTKAQYTVNHPTLTINEIDGLSLSNGDIITVTTWNDSDEMDLLTSVFIGPTNITQSEVELFDSALFDTTSFDSTAIEGVDQNFFNLYRTIDTPDALWVTKNGKLLRPNSDFIVSGGITLVITGDLVEPDDIIIVTSMSNSVVPNELSYRVFSDMRGNTAMYRNSKSNTAKLTQELVDTDDIIYVNDVTKLGIPDPINNIFGIVNINGERITYLSHNTTNNTISGLRRGTAGTAIIPSHPIDSIISDVGKGNVLNSPYDRIMYTNGDGTASNGISLQKQETAAAVFIKT